MILKHVIQPPGMILLLVLISNAFALSCSPGNYCNFDKSTCLPCGKGFYCPTVNMTQPYMCPGGEYTAEINSTNCLQCPAGYYCNRTDSLPIPCESGFYSLGRMTICLSCPAGYR